MDKLKNGDFMNRIDRFEQSIFDEPKGFTLPLIRRIYPKLIAKELVSVEPLTSPSIGGLLMMKYLKPEK